MSLVAELVSYQIAETEADLKKDDFQPDYSMIKHSMIHRAKLDLYGAAAVPDETEMHDIVKFYLADCAVVYIIDSAIDFYKSRSRLSDAKEGATFSYYDKVAILFQVKNKALTRIAKAEATVRAVALGITDLGESVGLPSTTMLDEGTSKVTVDPFVLARTLYGDYVAHLASMISPYPVEATRPQ